MKEVITSFTQGYLELFLQPDLTSRFWRSPYVSELRKLEYENIAKMKGVSLEVLASLWTAGSTNFFSSLTIKRQTHTPRLHAITWETAAFIREGKPFDYAQVTSPLGEREDYQVYYPKQLLSVDKSRERYQVLPL